jgi:hypothetical protein
MSLLSGLIILLKTIRMNARERRSHVPSKKTIALDWSRKYGGTFPDDDCWGCGITNCQLERCHLYASVLGGSNDTDNLIILCKFCHHFIQERHAGTKEGADFIKYKILEHHPFMSIKSAYMIEAIKVGMYDFIINDVNFPKDYREYITTTHHE